MSKLEQSYLKQIADECFPCDLQQRKIRERSFLTLRFDPKNLRLQHQQIAREMNKNSDLGNCTNAIGTTCQNVVRAIALQYESEMHDDGVNVNRLLNRHNDSSNGRGKKGHWEIVYTWLYEDKLPRWLAEEPDRIWNAWKNEAQSDVAKISFEEIADDYRKMRGKPRHKAQIYINRDYKMKIELNRDSEWYVLLLNRGQSCQGEETKYLVCPSPAFAPDLQPVKAQFTLPQSESEFEVINFDEPGREEYLGILIKEPPNLPAWMRGTEEDLLPTWNENYIYQLWQEIVKQANYLIFYQYFKVINN